MGCDSTSDAEPTAIAGKRATSFPPFLLLPALVAPGRSSSVRKLAASSRSADRSEQVVSSAFDLPYGSTNWTLVSTGKLLLRRIATAVNEPCWPFELQLSS